MIVRSLALSLALAFGIAHHAAVQSAQGHTQLRIGLITSRPAQSPASSSIARGVRLGAAESKQTATLFGDDVELFEATGAGTSAIAAAERMLSAQQVLVLIATSISDVEPLSRLAEARHVLFLNTASRSQSLRDECRRYTFHIEGTEGMYATASGAQRSAAVVLWGPSLERFGASQVNQRYRDKYHMEMDGPAWAGWVAVKIAAEGALRARSTEPAILVAYLESPTTQFDGHKGWPLTFRHGDHQLRQPLYVVETTGSAGQKQRLRDVPELRANVPVEQSQGAGGRGTDRALDTLIASPNAAKCR